MPTVKYQKKKIDLTCPVCKDLYREPVLLSCSHSFCKECLEKSWKGLGQKCPVCRKSCDGEQPISNRALMDATESFQKEKRWRGPNAISNVPLCFKCSYTHFEHSKQLENVHGRPFFLFFKILLADYIHIGLHPTYWMG
uniref:RING-type domain-containing protein n=1 Tax=Hucho hucho TaxID=62062 RepID=A0A4W5MBY8_9TELE